MSSQNAFAHHLNDGVPFESIVEQSVVGLYILQDEHFVYANAHWANIVGYTPAEMVGRPLADFVPVDFFPEVRERYYQRLLGDPPSMHYIARGLHKAGHEVHIEVHGTRVVYRNRPAIMGVGIDVTERVRHEAELRHYSEQIRQLLGYTRAKLDEQRQRFSRELHDQLGGMLSSLKMDATRILKRVDAPELVSMTSELIALTQQTIETVREIAADLRPGDLDHLDLSSVMQRDLDLFAKRYGVDVSFQGCTIPPGLSPRRATATYRIFQEALTNTGRHAQATRLSAAIRHDDRHFYLEMNDNGKGFDPVTTGSHALGLLGMRERARDLGAELTVTSAPGAGVQLRMRLPMV